MEWILQVVDEFDDALSAMRHGWLGLSAEIGMLLIGGVLAAVCGAIAMGYKML